MPKIFLQKAKRSETRPFRAQTQTVFKGMLQQAFKRFFASYFLTPFFNKAKFIVASFLLSAKVLIYLLLFGLAYLSSSPAHAKNPALGYLKKLKRTAKYQKLTQQDSLVAKGLFIEGQGAFIRNVPEVAFEKFQDALQIIPTNAAIHFKIAQLLYQYPHLQGRATTSVSKHIYAAMALAPYNQYYYLWATEMYINQQQYQQATAVYKKMLQKIVPTKDLLLNLANLYLYQKAYGKAIKIYNQIQRKQKITPEIILKKQSAYLLQNKFYKAIAQGKKLIKAYPDEEAYVVMLSEMFMANDQTQKAIHYLINYLNQYPSHAAVRLYLTQLLLQQGDFKNATTYAKAILVDTSLHLPSKLELMHTYTIHLADQTIVPFVKTLACIFLRTYPQEAASYVIYGDLYYTLNDQQQAQENYVKALALDSTNYNLWQRIITIFAQQKAMDNMINFSTAALQRFPNEVALYYYNGIAHLTKKQYKKAIHAFAQGKAHVTDNPTLLSLLHGQLGDAYHGLKQYHLADKNYEAALSLDDSNAYVLNNYSYFLALRKEKLALAQQMATKLIEQHAENVVYLDTYAWVLYQLGDYEKAQKYLEKAISIDEKNTNGEIIEHYGGVLYQLGKKQAAIVQWEKAKTMENVSGAIHKKLMHQKLYE